ncbi:Transcription factor HB29 [Acorus gramineus]|uniref:Transcription factor HB29 n=1 Tax=Acorus gramineus TaxID=55184 RepID=A0AAV9BLU4_ACOGR|nr:Transcription factor HB29 [Acorus gramineus]
MEEKKEQYGECLRNHAASLGSYATDGCGEFIPADESGLICAACGCHRNFHRKFDPMSTPVPSLAYSPATATDSFESGGTNGSNKKKRVRTKFTEEQKDKMMDFAESIGWKVPREEVDEDGLDSIGRFCRDIGVTRTVFKVWMHNHKNSASSSLTTGGGAAAAAAQDGSNADQ